MTAARCRVHVKAETSTAPTQKWRRTFAVFGDAVPHMSLWTLKRRKKFCGLNELSLEHDRTLNALNARENAQCLPPLPVNLWWACSFSPLPWALLAILIPCTPVHKLLDRYLRRISKWQVIYPRMSSRIRMIATDGPRWGDICHGTKDVGEQTSWNASL